MLGLGPGEIILVAVVIIVVVGPDRLPHFMRAAGRMYGQLRRTADEMRRAFVLEADRQDASARYEEIKRRREMATHAEPPVPGGVAQQKRTLKPSEEEAHQEVHAQVEQAMKQRHQVASEPVEVGEE